MKRGQDHVQMTRLKAFFRRVHDKPRIADRSFLSGIIFTNRTVLQYCDASRKYGPAKTLYDRWKRRSRNSVFARIMVNLATESAEHSTVIDDQNYLRHTAYDRASGQIKGAQAPDRANQRWHVHHAAHCGGCEGGQSDSSCRRVR